MRNPADPLRLNPVRLNPERLPDSGSISFILPPVRKPSRRCGEGFLFERETCLGRASNCGGFYSIFGCLLYGYYIMYYDTHQPVPRPLPLSHSEIRVDRLSLDMHTPKCF